MRTAVVTVALVLSTALLAGCDAAPDPAEVGDKADGTAAALVAALQAGDLNNVRFTDLTGAEADAELSDVVAGMGEATPEVRLGEVSEDGDRASAALSWTWALGADERWAYESQVSLTRATATGTGADTWEVVWGHEVVEPSLNAASVLELSALSGKRGDIVGAGGRLLVTERPVVRVGIDRGQVAAKKAGAAATQLARLVDIDADAYRARVEAAGARAFVEAITYRVEDVPRAVTKGRDAIDGVIYVPTELPLAVTRGFAAPIIGTVGEVTAEMIKDDPARYQVGDVAGLSGLQARYDEQLQGASGVVVNAVGSDDKEREIFRVDAADGEPLRLTLDAGLQTEAERLLADVAPASALVAIQPSTGAILAAANGPGNGGQNLATFGQYAPGSTFKSVTSLALLRRGITASTPVQCSTTITVDGKVFENYDGYPVGSTGQIPFRTALADSCNTAFISERGRLRDGDLAHAAASLGLGVDHDLGFPAYFGSVEPPTSETVGAADLIGQGTVLASPMAMATVIASIENGSLVVPRLLEQVEVAPPAGVTPVTAQQAATLRTLLRGVVTDGSAALLADLPGPDVIAKTGTAEFAAKNRSTATHAWMIAAQGDLAVAVFVDLGSSGSGTAGPIIEDFLRAAQ